MLQKNNWLMLLPLVLSCFFAMETLPCAAQQQANLSFIGNTTVTLYYYDKVNETKGGMVPMPDNPQYVNFDPALAAPGMYTFSHVPAGQWYYLEADHYGNKWYTIFYMGEGLGTKTANVHIPPFSPVDATSPTPSPSSSPMASPMATPTPIPSPGLTILAAIIGIAILASHIKQ